MRAIARVSFMSPDDFESSTFTFHPKQNTTVNLYFTTERRLRPHSVRGLKLFT